jgi:hypothetical protein
MRNAWRGMVVVSMLFVFALGAAVGQTRERGSAWEALVARDPGVVDDERVGWEERVALDALTPEQAVEYRRGADPGRLILEDGRTLEEYLEARLAPAAGLYVGLSSPCSLFSGEWWPSGAVREVAVRGRCGVPEEALAVVLELRAETLGVVSPRVKVWARDLPEPAGATLEGEANSLATSLRTTMIVNLCEGGWCDGDLRIRSAREVLLEARTVGYFRPLRADDTAGLTPIVSLYTESANNNFFGGGAGANTTGTSNSFFGGNAGYNNTTGSDNVFIGRYVGFSNTGGSYNAFSGTQAGYSNTTGNNNVFMGYRAGYYNTTGTDNAFFGHDAGFWNNGSNNAFFGRDAGYNNGTGYANSFFGRSAGRTNNTGHSNSFFGRDTGRNNGSGSSNSFFGYGAGFTNTNGSENAFFGVNAGYSNTVADKNSFFGRGAGFNNTAANNAFFGHSAGYNNTTGTDNAFFGVNAGLSNTIQHNNTFIGARSNGAGGITNATALGHRAQVSQSNSLVLGSVAGVNGATASVNVGIGTPAPERQLHLKGNNAVFRMDRDTDTAAFMLARTNAAGEALKSFVVGTNASAPGNGEFVVNDLGAAVGGPGTRRMTITNAGETHFTGTVRAPEFVPTSSLRFKQDVEPLRNAQEVVARLQGVSFVWKETGKASVGLIAEEVAEVIPEVVHRQENGLDAAGVNYSALVAVLVEAVKAQRREMETLRVRQQEIESLRAEVAELRSLEERLARLEVSRTAAGE